MPYCDFFRLVLIGIKKLFAVCKLVLGASILLHADQLAARALIFFLDRTNHAFQFVLDADTGIS